MPGRLLPRLTSNITDNCRCVAIVGKWELIGRDAFCDAYGKSEVASLFCIKRCHQ